MDALGLYRPQTARAGVNPDKDVLGGVSLKFHYSPEGGGLQGRGKGTAANLCARFRKASLRYREKTIRRPMRAGPGITAREVPMGIALDERFDFRSSDTERHRVVLSGRGRGAGDGGSGQKAWRCVFCGYWHDGQRERAGRWIRPQTPGAKNVAFWGLSVRAGMIIMGLLKYKPVVKRRTA